MGNWYKHQLCMLSSVMSSHLRAKCRYFICVDISIESKQNTASPIFNCLISLVQHSTDTVSIHCDIIKNFVVSVPFYKINYSTRKL